MRSWMIGAGVLFVALSVAVAAQARPYGGKVVTDVARVVDGDHISMGKFPGIRLQGIAAPEDNVARREPGGPESTANLRALVEGKNAVCYSDGTQTRRPTVAICFVEGRDVGLLQVLAGHARDCPRLSNGRYAATEAEARAAGRDLSAIYRLPSYCDPK